MMEPVTDYVTTASGKRLHFLDPSPDEIDLNDIARGMSMSCRWSGQIGDHGPAVRELHAATPIGRILDDAFLSVAEHSILTVDLMVERGESPVLRTYGYLHDASEAYFTDIPRPMKRMMPEYRRIEAILQGAIYRKFGLDPSPPAALKFYDNLALAVEAIQIGRELDPDIIHGFEQDGISAAELNNIVKRNPLRFWRPREAEIYWLTSCGYLAKKAEAISTQAA